MKTVFIPKGETVRYDVLYTGRLIVKGVLLVKGKIHAKEIIGGGVVEAGEIICDDIRLGSVTAGFITAKRIAVDKLFVSGECWTSESVAVTGFAKARYVSTGRLTVSQSDFCSFDADKVIVLPRKKRGLLGLLWASWWRSLYLSFYDGDIRESKGAPTPEKDKEGVPAEGGAPETPDSTAA